METPKYKPTKPAGGYTGAYEKPYTVLGCFGMVLFLVLELAAASGVVVTVFPPLERIVKPLFSAENADLGGVLAMIASFVPAGAAAFLIDRLCKRVTGHSAIENIPNIP